jgi:GNAT superfamily N-acetyltransferase
MMQIEYRDTKKIPQKDVIELYKSNKWSSAKKPDILMKALKNSATLISAWDGKKLVGLGNAITDGYLVVYYPHLLVDPSYQGKGTGKGIIKKMQEIYGNFHQQVLVADGLAIDFYKKCGFKKAGNCQALWLYKGRDHD